MASTSLRKNKTKQNPALCSSAQGPSEKIPPPSGPSSAALGLGPGICPNPDPSTFSARICTARWLSGSSFPGTALVAPAGHGTSGGTLLPSSPPEPCPLLPCSFNRHTAEFPRGPFCNLMLFCCAFLCSRGCWPSSPSVSPRKDGFLRHTHHSLPGTQSPSPPRLSPQAPLRLDTDNLLFRRKLLPLPALPLPSSGPVTALPSPCGPRHHWPRALSIPGRLCQLPPLSSQVPLGMHTSPQRVAVRSAPRRFPTLGGLPSSSTKSKSGETAYF